MSAIIAFVATAVASPVAAQSAASYDIDIPAAAVADAVALLRAQTGTDIAIDAGIAGTTQAVKGRMSVRQAVELMVTAMSDPR